MEQYLEFAGNHVALFAALAATIGMIVWSFIGPRISGYRKIEPQAAVTLLNNEGGIVLDIRNAKEFQEGHVVDSVHIPLPLLGKRHVEIAKYKDKPVIVTCRTGTQSSGACGLLRKQGFTSVYQMSGGILSWLAAKLPVSRKKK